MEPTLRPVAVEALAQDAYTALLEHCAGCPAPAWPWSHPSAVRGRAAAVRVVPRLAPPGAGGCPVTTTLHVCRACDEPIVDPDDAVLVTHELGNSGPGWDVYAHREHVDQVPLIDPDLLRIMTRVWTAKLGPGRRE